MSDDMDIPEDDFSRDDMLAAELSLGLLSGEDLVQAERRARIDRVFGDLVEDWDMRFAQMSDDIAPVTPPKGLLRKITNEAYPDSPKRLWQQLGILPAFLGAGAAALVLFATLQIGILMQANAPTFEAQIAAEDESIIVAAAFVEDSGVLSVEWRVGDRVEGRDVELWLIADGNAPVSLGVLNKGTKFTEFAISQDMRRLLAGGVMAVSDEPLGGSPTGAPTGTILAVGQITAG
ncbi:anti-sigma factor [Octadecabacter sp. G9-8]|uniref:Anti-sigma factor n=1 Tax=Octadecabacter dasysiphoniae TaxID=2909341 RepID=A0ABS9CTR2_9RHOB|nr:anti-sigma factor [Octadecabacter dasysiphoniae]MCF2870234.1 anti-sigma factor [Octadecabacter dasysiphoniae]